MFYEERHGRNKQTKTRYGAQSVKKLVHFSPFLLITKGNVGLSRPKQLVFVIYKSQKNHSLCDAKTSCLRFINRKDSCLQFVNRNAYLFEIYKSQRRVSFDFYKSQRRVTISLRFIYRRGYFSVIYKSKIQVVCDLYKIGKTSCLRFTSSKDKSVVCNL